MAAITPPPFRDPLPEIQSTPPKKVKTDPRIQFIPIGRSDVVYNDNEEVDEELVRLTSASAILRVSEEPRPSTIPEVESGNKRGSGNSVDSSSLEENHPRRFVKGKRSDVRSKLAELRAHLAATKPAPMDEERKV
jgi:hypothetical protein